MIMFFLFLSVLQACEPLYHINITLSISSGALYYMSNHTDNLHAMTTKLVAKFQQRYVQQQASLMRKQRIS